MIILYLIVLVILSVYSYALIDPNLTLFNLPIWAQFREYMVHVGYYQRDISWYIYFTIILFLFAFHLFFVKNYKRFSPVKIILFSSIILLVSYPFLSHDFFNYLFDAKILTYYHQNPYLHRALDFPGDPWLRFLHWTHRTYPYGPSFLVLTVIPSAIGMGKFIMHYFLLKLTFLFLFILSIYLISKKNRKWAMILATNPLIIMEGMVMMHNDLVGLALSLIGIYFLLDKNQIPGRILLLISAGIKYITFFPIFITKNMKLNAVLFALTLGLIAYATTRLGIQPWYFITLFVFVPFFDDFIMRLNIFFFALLVCYYPFIRISDWGTQSNVDLKNMIIYTGIILNIIYLLFHYLMKSRKAFLTR